MAKLTKQDTNKAYFRNLFALQFGWNHEKMQGLGCAYVIAPALKRLYGSSPDKMRKVPKTHLAYFNITPAISHLITSTDMALEKKADIKSEGVITGTKTGLMGPLAGVGDTLFIATYRTIVFPIAAYIALEGNPVGLLVPLITYAEVSWVCYKFATIGYNSGRKLAAGFVDKVTLVTEAANILGLTAVNALIPSVIKYSTDLQSVFDEITFALQEMLDKIFPCALPLGTAVFSYWLLGKRKIDSTKLIFILIGPGMILNNLQNTLTFVAGSS